MGQSAHRTWRMPTLETIDVVAQSTNCIQTAVWLISVTGALRLIV
jgi:hypothetical protein